MPPLAQRNLLHDKVRLTVTLTGIVFAVVLIVVELGLFVGFTVTTSSIIDKSQVDFWIVSRHTPYIEQGAAFSERKLYQVLGTPGVASADKYIVRFAQWKTHEGAEESVQGSWIYPRNTCVHDDAVRFHRLQECARVRQPAGRPDAVHRGEGGAGN